MNWYLDCWKKYATFAGRARRREYWMFVLWNAVFGIGVVVLDAIVGGGGALFTLFSLASLLPSLAVCVRRLHDTDRCGWWILISFVPFVGGIWFLILMVLEGSCGANRYGEDPKEGR